MKHQAHYFIRPLAILLVSLALISRVQAAGWQVVDILTKTPAKQYGKSIAISRNGNIAAVSQTAENCVDGKVECGAVFTYIRDQGHWRQQVKLFASDPADYYTNLGKAVALNDDGTVMAVSASDAVYLFVRNGDTWQQQQKLTPPINLLPTPQVNTTDKFGNSIALSGDGKSLAVGTVSEGLEKDTGAVYVFTKAGGQWLAETRLVGSRVVASPYSDYLNIGSRASHFGSAVDISGDGKTLLVGSHGVPTDLEQAYIFTKNKQDKWGEQTILTPADKDISPNGIGFDYGVSVALSGMGNLALVGTSNGGNGKPATAYVYAKMANGTWAQETKLGANIAQVVNSGTLSFDLDVLGRQIVVSVGNTFLYTRAQSGNKAIWSPQLVMRANNELGAFGRSLAMSGDAKTILITNDYATTPITCGTPIDGIYYDCAQVYTLVKK